MKPNFGGEVERRKCSRRVSPSEHRHRGMMPTETRIKISAFTREQDPAFKPKDKEEGVVRVRSVREQGRVAQGGSTRHGEGNDIKAEIAKFGLSRWSNKRRIIYSHSR